MKIEIKTPNWEPKAEHLRRLVPDYFQPARNAATLKVAQTAQDKLKEEGRPSTSPVQWDSERQRRAFFATNGFGGGIPHRRTGEYQDGWKIEPLDNRVRLYNDTPGAVHVSGGFTGLIQSSIHKGRWVLAKPIVGEMLNSVKDAQTEAIRQAILDFYADQP